MNFRKRERISATWDTRISYARDTSDHLNNLPTVCIMHKHSIVARVQLVTSSMGLHRTVFIMRTTLMVYYISPITRELLLRRYLQAVYIFCARMVTLELFHR